MSAFLATLSTSILGQLFSALLSIAQAHPYMTFIAVFVVFGIVMFSKATSSNEHAYRR
jgi:hypothetical protein